MSGVQNVNARLNISQGLLETDTTTYLSFAKEVFDSTLINSCLLINIIRTLRIINTGDECNKREYNQQAF